MIGTRVSHYRLEQKLGEGTYGGVYKGVHVHDPVLQAAVKVVHPGLAGDAEFVESLRRECRALYQLQHPGIVGFRELVLGEGAPAMILELLDGQDLVSTVSAGPADIDRTVEILLALLEALAYAHRQGMVHRDIKPSNIQICSDGRIKLLDFGIARAADGSQATKTGQIQGTLDYLAPEVFHGQSASEAADIYASGLVAWELLAGRPACADGPLGAKMGWHMGVGPQDVRTVRPDCPAWLAEVVATLTSKEMDHRPADGAAALAMVVEAGRAAGAITGSWDAAAGSLPPGTKVAATTPAPGGPTLAPPADLETGIPERAGGEEAPRPKKRLYILSCLLLVLLGWIFIICSGMMLSTCGDDDEAEETLLQEHDYELVEIKAGSFVMGSPADEEGRGEDEVEHFVKISAPFMLARHEVHQKLYKAVMDANPSKHSAPFGDYALENLSWFEAITFCNELSRIEGRTPAYEIGGAEVLWNKEADGYRLPTEAEWEYAARAGTKMMFSGASTASRVAHYDQLLPSDDYPGFVSSKRANAWDLKNMSGNVSEWVWDWYGPFDTETVTDPAGPQSGTERVQRGGSYKTKEDGIRVAARASTSPQSSNGEIGFRIARSLPPDAPAGAEPGTADEQAPPAEANPTAE